MITGLQFVTDEQGKRVSAIVPIALFEKLAASADIDELYESVPYSAGPDDSVTVPHEVVKLTLSNGVTTVAAWRMYRGMTQKEVADALGVTTSSVTQMEKRAKPQNATLEKLAVIYDCKVEQLYL